MRPIESPRKTDLPGLLSRLSAGEHSPWLLLEAGLAAAECGEWPFALECLRRIDPCSPPAVELRDRLMTDPHCPLAIPTAPGGLADDPAEIVARAFTETIAPVSIWKRLVHLGPALLLGALGMLATVFLPDAWARPLQAAIFTGFLGWLFRDGMRVREQAWLRPDHGEEQPSGTLLNSCHGSWVPAAVALVSLIAPSFLGFTAGLGWSVVLTPFSAGLGIVLLVSAPLHVLGTGFPFAAAPRPRETGAFLFAGLLACAGAVLSGLLLWVGSVAAVAALFVAYATWRFINRCAGLLARRILLRLEAERAALLPILRPVEAITSSDKADPAAVFVG